MLNTSYGGNPSACLSCTTPLDFSNDSSIFSGISALGETSSLTTKASFFFISFDSTKNSPRLHIDMNLGFFSSVDFGISGIILSSRDFTLLKSS